MSFPVEPEAAPLAEASPHPVVLSVAFPYAPIGNKAVGGAEVICSQVEAAAAAAGFRSVVVAHDASMPSGRLYPTHVPRGLITDEVRSTVQAEQQANIDLALRDHPVALVHMHGLDFDQYTFPDDLPIIVTLHLPPSWYPETIWTSPVNYHFVCVSQSQHRACPEGARSRVTVIENGVPLPDAKTLRPEGRYALMLARICREKNLHVGFDAARMAGMPAILGGEVFAYEAHERYLAEEIQPRLTGTGVCHEDRRGSPHEGPSARFLGPVAGEEKGRLLGRAACLLLPTLAPETSSLVAMEALAAGVPVIGMAVGAVPEIVEDGRTGFLVQPGAGATEQMSEAIRRLPALDRSACRAAAEERFPMRRMLEQYFALYRRLARLPAEKQDSPAVEPRMQGPFTAEEIESPAAFEALAPEWTYLWAADRRATPFQHPAWLLPWWRQFGPEGTLHAVAVREDSTQQLAGLLPLYTYGPPDPGHRQLLLVGAGTTDYLDGVWRAPGAAEAALRFALATVQDWSQLSLHQLRERSPLTDAVQGASLPLVAGEPCSTLEVAVDLPAKIRNNVSRYERLAAAAGTLHCEVTRTVEASLATFEELVEMHGRRWKERGEEGVLQDERVLAHHRESLPPLLQAGLLRMFRLRLGDELLGVLYGLADGEQAAERRLYLYLIGFEARFARLSPGTLLLHAAWRHAREHGFQKVDLLRGGETYKQLWGAQAEGTLAVELPRESVR